MDRGVCEISIKEGVIFVKKVAAFSAVVIMLFGLFGCSEPGVSSVVSNQSLTNTAQSGAEISEPENGVICNYPKLVDGARGHTLYYLETGGTLYGWGKNYNYLLGLPIPEQYYSYKPTVLATDVADVVNNMFTTYMLKKDGTLWVLGYYPHAEDGSDYAKKWIEIAQDIKQICGYGSGKNICGVLKKDGSLYILGSTYDGNVTATKPNEEIDQFVLRPADTGVEKLGGVHHDFYGNEEDSAKVNIGVRITVGYFKDNAYWQVVENQDGSFTLQKLVDGNIAQVPIGGRFDYYLDLDGNLRSVTDNRIISANVTTFAALSGNEPRCLFVTSDHKLWEIGETTQPFDGNFTIYSSPCLILEDVEKVYGASDTVFMDFYILKTDETLWCWGLNNSLLGNGTANSEIARGNENISEETPVKDRCDEITQVLNISNIRDFCYSTQVKVAVTQSGERYIWGLNPYYRAFTAGTSEKDSPHAEYYKDQSAMPQPAQVNREDSLLVATTWTEAFAKYE